MNFLTMAVIVLGLVFGYWAVAAAFKAKTPRSGGPSQADDGSDAPFASRQRTTDAPQRWYQVLAVSPSASPDEIRAAYRLLMSQYHPDKVNSLGVELQALAERKSKEIGAAYREGMNANGLPT